MVFDETEGRVLGVGEECRGLPVSKTIRAPSGAVLTAGLIDAHTHMGICELGNGPEYPELDECGTDFHTLAHTRTGDSFRFTDEAFDEALSAGVCAVHILPGSLNGICGQGCFVATYVEGYSPLVISQTTGLKVALGENPSRRNAKRGVFPVTGRGITWQIRELLSKKGDALAERIVSGELPIHAHVHRVDDIRAILGLKREFGFRLVLHHASEAHLVAEELVQEQVAVIAGPLIMARLKRETKLLSWDGLKRLLETGVKVALASDHPVIPVQYLRLCAILSVVYGVSEEAAWGAITESPAEILGASDRGVVRRGAVADLVLWQTDPLDLRSSPLAVWSRGKLVRSTDQLRTA
ncbi:MAG: amidohydrolase family protein [Bacillota bacterium]